MKNLVYSVFVAAVVLLTAPQMASASTFQSFHCACTAPTGENCSCSFSYTLGKLVTKEFRGYCDNIGGDTPIPDLYVHDLNKGNTCTIQANSEFVSPPYRSRSCTNWSLTRSDSLNIETICYNQDSGGSDF